MAKTAFFKAILIFEIEVRNNSKSLVGDLYIGAKPVLKQCSNAWTNLIQWVTMYKRVRKVFKRL